MFIVIKTYHPLEQVISTAGTFWIYSGFCLLGVIFVITIVPETKGKDLDSIEKLFKTKNKEMKVQSSNNKNIFRRRCESDSTKV